MEARGPGAGAAGMVRGGAAPPLPPLPALQLSLDHSSLRLALPAAAAAVEAGIDWLEVGTPLVTGEGMRSVELLRALHPDVTIVVDLKNMDGGGGAAARVADAGGTFVVVMGLSSPRTVEAAVEQGHARGVLVMVDVMGMEDKVAAGRRFAEMGCDVVVAHVGVDERRGAAPRTAEEAIALAAALPVPVQAVGGLTLEDLSALAAAGVPLAVLGGPLVSYAAEGLAGLPGVVRQAAERFGGGARHRTGGAGRP